MILPLFAAVCWLVTQEPPRVFESSTAPVRLTVARGSGGFLHRLERGGDVVWAEERPFGFDGAHVFSSGAVIGHCSTTRGTLREGLAAELEDEIPMGFLGLVVVGATGTVSSVNLWSRRSGFGEPIPKVFQLLAWESASLGGFRVAFDDSERWLLWNVDYGEAVATLQPASAFGLPNDTLVVEATPLDSTTLVALRTKRNGAADRDLPAGSGSRLVIADVLGPFRWSHEEPDRCISVVEPSSSERGVTLTLGLRDRLGADQPAKTIELIAEAGSWVVRSEDSR